MEEKKENIIIRLSFEFALNIVEYAEMLEEKRKFVIANQLLKSGTSIGANIREAQNAESKNDFIHKFKIAAKEADETEYWLLLCKFAKNYPDSQLLLDKLYEMKKIISKIIITSKIK
ncbi:four helix bundle protein [Rhodocytophaga rosea]|uniref:Four helix bundle protein n=1 Tax=Rhodocytophaga rosea TaxID=2704465 RepID=A0A6C0GPR2_9BACT|nr:four helix bundle protein [Rhodocytophaga rosea]QHT69824.1 four helix bundle protein [Rhodocytophaga rosea]